MSVLGFDWDEENIRHLARHKIAPDEAEQVILNRPIDIDSQLRSGEDRTVQVGETDAGRILIAVSAMQGSDIRIITAWPANERFRRYFLTQKRNGNVGRIEEQDVRE